MPRLTLFACSAVLAAGITAASARAQTVVPGPGETGHDAALADRAEGWVRLQQGILSVPLGFGLEAFVADPSARSTIEAFVASGEISLVSSTRPTFSRASLASIASST